MKIIRNKKSELQHVLLFAVCICLIVLCFNCTNVDHTSQVNPTRIAEFEDSLFNAVIKIENDTNFASANFALHGFSYLVSKHYASKLIVTKESMQLLHHDSDHLQGQYKLSIEKDSLIHATNFSTINVTEVTNKTPIHLRFSKPMKCGAVWVLNFEVVSWYVGYKTIIILNEVKKNKFKILYRGKIDGVV